MLAEVPRLPSLLLSFALVTAGCGATANDEPAGAGAGAAAPVRIETAKAVEQPITRFIRVTGTLTAQEQAEVAAEIAGRIVATPVERGTIVSSGADLVRIAAAEAEAQALEAEANAAQIQARLGQAAGETLDAESVPEVAAARAGYELAQADFERVRMLFERQLVAKAEFDQRRAQVETMRRQYESARNGAEQQRQALVAASARLALARKALADTVVRAPFQGVVAERLVSVGDYVTRGTKVASVLRINPLRVELSVPAQYIAALAVGRTVSFEVDAFPGQTFTGQVRYVSPEVRADSRSMIVEAVVPNASGTLKPGLFATAQIEEAAQTPGVLVPAVAVRTVSGTSRVYVVADGQVEERIVTIGQAIDRLIEVTSGLEAGEVVATTNVAQLSDGVRVGT